MGRWKLSLILALVSLFCMSALLVAFRPVARANPTTIFSDGFESGDLSAWSGTYVPNGTTVEVVSSPVFQGSYAVFLSDGGVYGGSTPYLWKNFTQVNTAYARFYVRFNDSGWASGERALFCVFGMSEYINYAAQVAVYNNNGTYVWRLSMEDDGATPFSVISTQTVSMNTWYCVEVKQVSDASVGGCTLYIDGTQLLSITGKNTVVTGKCDMLFMDGELIGYPTAPTNTYFDDFVVSDAYIGPEGAVTFDQTGVGSDFTGTVVTIDGTGYNTSELPQSFLWDQNSTHTFSYASPLSVNAGEQYAWTSTSGLSSLQNDNLTISGPGSVTGNYVTQYYITVISAHGNPTEASQWVNDSDAFSVSVTNPDVVSALKHQWNLTGLTVDSSPQTLNDTVSFAAVHASHTIEFDWTEQFYVTFAQSGVRSDFSGAVMAVNGTSYGRAGAAFWADSGDVYNFTYANPLNVNASMQYRLTGVNASSPLTVTAAATINGSYVTQWYITVTSAHDSPTASAWVDNGTDFNASVTSPTEIVANDHQWICAGYSIDGASSTPGTSYDFLSVVANHTIDFSWTEQFWIVFAQNGVGSDFSGNVMNVSALNYTRSGFSGWFDSGTNVLFNYYSPLVVTPNSKQYLLTGVNDTSPLTVSGAESVTGTYKTQYYVTFAQSGVGSDFTGTVVTVNATGYNRLGTSFWTDSGNKYTFSFASPLTVNASKQYSWSSTSGLSNLQNATLTITASGSVVGNYIIQNQVTFDKVGVTSDFNGTVLTVDGINYNVTELPVSFSWTLYSNHTFTYQSPLVVGANSKQYVWTSTTGLSSLQGATMNVTTFGSIVGNYVTQYYITFAQSGVGVDFSGTVVTVNGTGHDRNGTSFWADSSSVYNFSYASPLTVTLNVKQYAWIYTSGLSSVQSGFLTVSSNGSIVGNYALQYNVTFAQSGLDGTATGTVVTVNGSAKSFASLPYSIWVNSSDSINYNYTSIVSSSASGKRFSFSSATGPASPVNVTSAVTVTGHYTTQYNVTFGQSGVGSDFSGTVMTVNGTTHNRLGVSFWANPGDVYNFTYATPLTVNASAQYIRESVNASSPLTVSAATTVTGSYVTQYWVTFDQDGLDGTATGTVVTVNGTAKTSTGLPFSAWFNSSDTLVFSYANVSSTASDMYFVVYSVSANSPLTVTGPVTIIGYYKTELLTMQLKGTKGWYWTQDTTATCTVTGDLYGNGVVEIVTGGYYFDGVRDVAQLVIWNGSNRAVLGVTVWYWYGSTTINSVAIGDLYGNGSMEIVTGGSYFDGTRHVAQLVVWDASTLAVRQVKVWTWVNDTTINSVAISDVDGDGHLEIITGGYYFDNTRDVAQLVVWNASTLTVKQVKVWTWGGNTIINSLAVGDVDGDGHREIVTGGYYFDGTRDAAQLVVWNSTLAAKQTKVWSWGNNTAINSVAIGDVYGNGSMRIVTGGYYLDGSRDVAQLVIWNGSSMSIDGIKVWYWFGDTTIHSVAIGDVDQDGRTEIVTGGSYFDGIRNVSQLVVWDTSMLTVKQVAVWSAGGNTVINCVVIGDVNEDGLTEIVTGGNYYDGTRMIAQLTVWSVTYS